MSDLFPQVTSDEIDPEAAAEQAKRDAEIISDKPPNKSCEFHPDILDTLSEIHLRNSEPLQTHGRMRCMHIDM